MPNGYKIINLFRTFFEKQGISSFVYLYVPSVLVYMKDLICKFPYISIAKVNFTPISLSDTAYRNKHCRGHKVIIQDNSAMGAE